MKDQGLAAGGPEGSSIWQDWADLWTECEGRGEMGTEPDLEELVSLSGEPGLGRLRGVPTGNG